MSSCSKFWCRVLCCCVACTLLLCGVYSAVVWCRVLAPSTHSGAVYYALCGVMCTCSVHTVRVYSAVWFQEEEKTVELSRYRFTSCELDLPCYRLLCPVMMDAPCTFHSSHVICNKLGDAKLSILFSSICTVMMDALACSLLFPTIAAMCLAKLKIFTHSL